jgi:multiple sugar transport system permease protein
VPALFAYNEAFKYGNFGYDASMGVVMALAIVGMISIYLKVSKREDTQR